MITSIIVDKKFYLPMNHLDKEYLVTKKKKEEEYVFSRIDYPNRYVSWLPETYFDLMGIINYTHHSRKRQTRV